MKDSGGTVNKVILMGCLGNDPETKFTTSGTNEIIDFLKSLAKKSFIQGDNYYARLNKNKTAYIFGYTNDYPLQHGEGKYNTISINLAEYLYEQLGQGGKNIT